MVKHMGSSSIISYSFGNIPDLVLCIVWTRNVKELREMCQDLGSERRVPFRGPEHPARCELLPLLALPLCG